jgi:hypothetical protein
MKKCNGMKMFFYQSLLMRRVNTWFSAVIEERERGREKESTSYDYYPKSIYIVGENT